MLATKYRPKRFGEVVGQDNVVSVLKSITKSPIVSPRSIILYGPWGSGKSSLARIFVRALNCQFKREKEPCLVCEVCAGELSFSSFYQELDATQVGNVEFIRSYRNDLQLVSVPKNFNRVIIFDESQSASVQAQSALLKILEDVPERTFFVFATTAVEKMLPTIRSRSVELNLQLVSSDKIFERLGSICTSEGISIPEGVLYRIANYAGGHVRDALMRLDLYSRTEDKTSFIESISSTEKIILEFLVAVKDQDREKCEELVKEFVKKPLAFLFNDFEFVVLSLLKKYTKSNFYSNCDQLYSVVIEKYGQDVFKFLKILASEWVTNCFR
ncbi:MAG TPA: AAA family ATPase, partial [bacterium]|nr:AAA family ATPase [bacterium]